MWVTLYSVIVQMSLDVHTKIGDPNSTFLNPSTLINPSITDHYYRERRMRFVTPEISFSSSIVTS